MSKALPAVTALCLLAFSTPVFAGDPGSTPDSTVPSAGLFIGLGGSFNAARIDQDIGGDAISNVFQGSTLIATGQAGGPPASFDATESAFAPMAQVGYFGHFNDSNWLWGAKFSYQYLNVDLAIDRALVPQVGSFTTTGPAPTTTPFTGNVVIGSSQTTVEHEMLLLAFIGRSFANSYVYLGAAPHCSGRSRISRTRSGLRISMGGLPMSLGRPSVSPAPSGWRVAPGRSG